jgi:hypothetical protein
MSSEKYKHHISTQGIYEIHTREYCIHLDFLKVCVICSKQPKHNVPIQGIYENTHLKVLHTLRMF